MESHRSIGSYQGNIGNSPVFFRFGIRGLSPSNMTRLVSEHDQTHIRSPFETAAPISRLRRARLRKTRPFFKSVVQAIPDFGSSAWIRQDLIGSWKITEFGHCVLSSDLHHGAVDDDTSSHI